MKSNSFVNLLLNTSIKRRFILTVIDLLCFVCINILYIVFSNIGDPSPEAIIFNSLLHVSLIFLFRWIFRVYRNVWRYSNTKAYCMILVSDCLAGLVTIFSTAILNLIHRRMARTERWCADGNFDLVFKILL